MKTLATALLVATALATVPAWADRGGWHGGGHERHEWQERHEFHRHGHGGIFVGPSLFWPGYAPPFDPLYGFPPAPAVVEPPPVYIERGGPPPAPPDTLWYYCDAVGAYYPYVKQCPGGWRMVAPQQQ